ncbi:TOPRS ligase, partial [Penelope pileata]|nr:TOPRS ligase [Penelope pileata]
MATEEAWACPICQDARRDVAYAMPCSHQFCLGCIQRWARLRDSCPLCRTPMHTIRVSVGGDEQYLECIVSPPALPVPVGFDTVTGPERAAVQAPLRPPPPPPQHRDAQQDVRAALGGLLPDDWAAIFRARHRLLDPALRWMHRLLSILLQGRWWQLGTQESLILRCLCVLGLDRDALIEYIQPVLGPVTPWFVSAFISFTVGRCSQEARTLLGLQEDGAAQEQEDGPAAAPAAPSPAPQDTQELPGPPSRALRGAAAQLPTTPSPEEQPRQELGQEAAGPSTQGRGTQDSCGRPRHPRKRRAGSTPGNPQPPKRPPPRRR